MNKLCRGKYSASKNEKGEYSRKSIFGMLRFRIKIYHFFQYVKHVIFFAQHPKEKALEFEYEYAHMSLISLRIAYREIMIRIKKALHSHSYIKVSANVCFFAIPLPRKMHTKVHIIYTIFSMRFL